ncbi:unnamed protein product [Amoebophrya sp. A25]|nr:unnamed protein product [Amoebophrya sp. A25]|eukprot:GSA25T00007866001.1
MLLIVQTHTRHASKLMNYFQVEDTVSALVEFVVVIQMISIISS